MTLNGQAIREGEIDQEKDQEKLNDDKSVSAENQVHEVHVLYM